MDIKDTTARLRRTFHYPTDDSSNSATPEVLDEEEQETLIRSLAEQNAATNQQYQLVLLCLPILASIPYLLALFRPPTLLIAVLGLTSLASTSFLLINLPITETGIPLLDAWARSSGSSRSHEGGRRRHDDDSSAIASGWASGGEGPSGLGALNQMRQRRRTNSLTYETPKSPLEKYLPLLNVGLCAILIMSGVLASRTTTSATNPGGGGGGDGGGDGGSNNNPNHHQFGWLGLGNLPAIVYAVVTVAKMVMASVDPERELGALKYGYKGA